MESSTPDSNLKTPGESVTGHSESPANDHRFDANSLIVWGSNPAGGEYHVHGWTELTGQSEAEAVNEGWFAVVHPDDLERVTQTWKANRANSSPLESEFRIRAKNGEYRHVMSRAVPINSDGLTRGWIGAIFDITESKRATDALVESESRFRALFEDSGSGMALVDMEGHPVKCNPALEKLLGYTEEELSAMAFTEFTHEEDRDLDWGLYSELTAGKREKYEIEKRFITKDSRTIWASLIVSLVRDPEGAPRYAVGMVQDITKRKEAEEELRLRSEQLRALADKLRSAREEEGIRIARELHDELGSALTSVKWGLMSLAKPKASGGTSDTGTLMEMTTLIDNTINTVRRISSELRPSVLDDLGLVPAIEWHALQFQNRAGIVCRIDSLSEVNLSSDQATAVFRIFQEGLTNVLRHANATAVNVLLSQEDSLFTMEIRDNGRGITEAESLGLASLGLLGMRERAQAVGGELDIHSELGRGTVLGVRVPV